ncbi:lysophospholipid acyltransferase family protein [Niveispirillum sp. BGYR6]|uniref:lysophospholipid acyltransferase family protein n=1 Tax=Niveispirillum sp. BGYR6 TaxID=2971249 RepID=UPI0022B9C875|nr:lysophospholipid acyltransferase family protein [Niveispirillum sp. BGYR6]MDG5495774.1 lysophospholipid acyltransferase family protein [Niveispirillum sp. BGYR6]
MDIGSTGRGIVRLSLYAIVTALGIPLQVLFLRFGGPYARFPVAYHRLCCRILGLNVVTQGRPVTDRATLFISNHSSYLDIPVLGSLLPTSFVAKNEVGGWPLFGLLARLQRTVFVDRNARHRADEQRDSIAGRLQAGDKLVLFPEGTSSDGNRTLPFKTALFAVAATQVDGKPLTLQPVSVTATHLDGLPLGHAWRALYAWYGDMELPPHLWQLARLGGRIRVLVEFHPPVSLADFSSRKALADHCWRSVAAGVERAVKGRDEPVAENDDAALPAASATAAG